MATTEVPELHCWRVLSLDTENGSPASDFLIMGLFGPPEAQGYDVMLSDGATLWREKMGTQEMLSRHKVIVR
jgi:hypothetical protein